MIVFRNGRRLPGFSLGGEESDKFRVAITELIETIKDLGRALSPREKLILELGLKASHMEESMASGDWKRAEAHADGLVELLKKLKIRQ